MYFSSQFQCVEHKYLLAKFKNIVGVKQWFQDPLRRKISRGYEVYLGETLETSSFFLKLVFHMLLSKCILMVIIDFLAKKAD